MTAAPSSGGDSTLDGGGDLVVALFGDLLDDVAIHQPVARSELVRGLADLADADVVGVLSAESVAVVPASPVDVAVYTLAPTDWMRLADHYGLESRVLGAVRRAHERLATALGVDAARPFVTHAVDG